LFVLESEDGSSSSESYSDRRGELPTIFLDQHDPDPPGDTNFSGFKPKIRSIPKRMGFLPVIPRRSHFTTVAACSRS